MAKSSRISPDEVAKIKHLLFTTDMKQDAIAQEMDISQALVSRVKSGYQHPNVPWPDGSIGAMPSRRQRSSSEGEELSMDAVEAKRFDSWPPKMQLLILEAVNMAREKMDMPPIPSESQELVVLMGTPMLAPEEEVKMRVTAKEAEAARKAAVMRAFDAITSEDERTSREETCRAAVAAPRVLTPPEGELDKQIAKVIEDLRSEDPTYEAVGWKELLGTVPANMHVRAVLVSGDKVLKEATCIVFAHTPTSMWNSKILSLRIAGVREHIATFPNLVASISDLPGAKA